MHKADTIHIQKINKKSVFNSYKNLSGLANASINLQLSKKVLDEHYVNVYFYCSLFKV